MISDLLNPARVIVSLRLREGWVFRTSEVPGADKYLSEELKGEVVGMRFLIAADVVNQPLSNKLVQGAYLAYFTSRLRSSVLVWRFI